MNEFETTPDFEMMSLDDIEFDGVENEDGSYSYDKPETTENLSEEISTNDQDFTGYGEEPVVVNAANILADVDDTTELDFGDGRKFSKSKLVELSQRAQQIEDEHTYVSTLASNLKHSEKHLEFIKQRSLSEVDKQVAAVNQMLRDPMLSDAERGARVRQLDGLVKRQNELNSEFATAQQLLEGQKAEMLGKRIKDTDEAMIKRYGVEWQTSANDVYQFVIAQGVSPDDIKEVLSGPLANVFVMARKYAMLDAKRKEKANSAIKETIQRSKTGTKAPAQRDDFTTQRKQAIHQKVTSGKGTQNDLMDAYSMMFG